MMESVQLIFRKSHEVSGEVSLRFFRVICKKLGVKVKIFCALYLGSAQPADKVGTILKGPGEVVVKDRHVAGLLRDAVARGKRVQLGLRHAHNVEAGLIRAPDPGKIR